MIASWMIYTALVSTLLMAVAAMLERVLRSAGKPARLVWLAAIAAPLLSPVVVVILGQVSDSVGCQWHE